MFAQTTRYFSIDAKLRVKKTAGNLNNTSRNKAVNIIQNFIVLFCIMQVCIVYFTSGFYQIMGESWNNGTAIYYISQVKSISMPFFENMVKENIYFIVILSYLSIMIKLAFPFLIINKKTKFIAVFLMFCFHLAIAVGMGLYTFSIIMLSVELLIFSDAEYKQFYNLIKGKYKKYSNSLRDKTNSFGETKLENYKMIVFYDGWCPLCQKTKVQIKKYDLFNIVEFQSFRNTDVLHKYNLNSELAARRMHSKTLNNKVVSGIDSFIDMSKRIPVAWPFVPILILGKWLKIGNLIYNYVADNRKIIPVNQCNDNLCNIPSKIGD